MHHPFDALDGAPNSAHALGRAADFHIPGQTDLEAVRRRGAGASGLHAGFVPAAA